MLNPTHSMLNGLGKGLGQSRLNPTLFLLKEGSTQPMFTPIRDKPFIKIS